jgi:FtsZ-interacting cell division protein ZipA
MSTTAGTTSALTSDNLRGGIGSTMTATMSEEADGGVDDPRKPLLDATVAGVSSTKAHAKNRNHQSGSYNATTFTRSISSSHREERDEREREEDDDDEEEEEEEEEEQMMENISRKSQWILLAVASGACAAFNGVFAKL